MPTSLKKKERKSPPSYALLQSVTHRGGRPQDRHAPKTEANSQKGPKTRGNGDWQTHKGEDHRHVFTEGPILGSRDKRFDNPTPCLASIPAQGVTKDPLGGERRQYYIPRSPRRSNSPCDARYTQHAADDSCQSTQDARGACRADILYSNLRYLRKHTQ